MSGPRGRLSVAAAVAAALGTLSLASLYSSSGWMAPTVGVVAVVCLVATAGRAARLPAVLELPVVAAAVLCYVTGLFAPRHAWGRVVPTLATFGDLHGLLHRAGVDIGRLPAPVPSRPDLVLVAVLGVAAMTLLVDLAAVVALSPSIAGMALLAAYLLASVLSPHGVGLGPFLAAAVGWLLLLGQDERAKLLRWGDDAGAGGRRRIAAAAGRRVGLAAVGVALVVPAVVPGLGHVRLTGTGGNGAASVTTYNPLVAVQGDLEEGRPRALLVYRTDDAHPDYLQLTTLDSFDGDTWSATPLTAGAQERISNGVPTPVDAMTQPGADVRTAVQVLDDLSTRWLPAPAPLEGASARGDWRYDPTSGTIFSAQTTSQGLSYSVDSRHLTPDPATIGPGTALGDAVPRRYLALPPGLPRVIAATARRVTRGAPNDFARAVALQDWLRSPPFVYSLTTANASGTNAIVTFLKAKRGFCEQYAATMAVMARTLGIPARVAVGFTPGTPTGRGEYVVTSADAHAWPELFFAGVGWLRFEPTPRGDGQATAPAYTTDPSVVSTLPPSINAATPSASPGGATSSGSVGPQERNSVPAAASRRHGHGAGAGWPLPLGLALAAVALAAPGLVRWRVRRRRISRGGGLLWSELADAAADLGVGVRWRAADSPRRSAARLVASGRLDSGGTAALHRLVGAEERRRYARDGGGATGVPAAGDLAAVTRSLAASARRPRRVAARVAPASTLRWAAGAVSAAVQGVLEVTDAAGGRLVGAVARVAGAETRRA